MKVLQEPEKCIGCGTCVAICSSLFEMDGAKAKLKNAKTQGKTLVLEKKFTKDEEECAKAAAGSCPVSCIIVK
ncbi:MAG: ferredoxin [Candidatus Diapherotrites archaeon]